MPPRLGAGLRSEGPNRAHRAPRGCEDPGVAPERRLGSTRLRVMARTAGIVVIGDEILSGKFADENAAFLIRELRGLGVDLDEIADTVPWHSARFDHVFTSGGVGPTHDDVTIAGIARGFGTTVVRHA